MVHGTVWEKCENALLFLHENVLTVYLEPRLARNASAASQSNSELRYRACSQRQRLDRPEDLCIVGEAAANVRA